MAWILGFAWRLIGLLAVLLAMTLVVFALQRIVPGDAARAVAGPTASVESVEQLRETMGLNDPLPTQYGRYLGGLLEGDLGVSVRTRRPVMEDLAQYAPASIELIVAALVFGIVSGAGAALAGRRGGALRLVLVVLGSAPIFLTGLLLALVFWFRLDWLPGAGRGLPRDFEIGPTGLFTIDAALAGRPDLVGVALAHLALPAITLAIPVAVAVARTLRGTLDTELERSYARTARSMGLSERRVVLGHALRNSLGAPLTMVGLQLGLLFANILVVERIFAWPGLGLYTTQAFDASDLPAVLGVALMLGTIYVLANALIDATVTWADPRMRR